MLPSSSVMPMVIFAPMVILAICWGWLWWAHRRGWDQPQTKQPPSQTEDEPQADPSDQNQSTPDGIRHQVMPYLKSRWGGILVGVSAFLLLYLFVFAGPRPSGEIPITPHQLGRPFYNLHWLRDFTRDQYEHISLIIAIIGSVLSIGVLIWAHYRRWRYAGQVSLLLISLTLAGLGQWWLNNELLLVGMSYYTLAISGFISWVWMAHNRLPKDLEPQPISERHWEWFVVIGVIALAIFARTYALRHVPYGIEGDESKWIFEVVGVMLDGQSDSSGEYHHDALPLSFYMQAPFQRILGAGILSARIGVAIYSILGTFIFYWLVRGMAPLPLAALSTFLLSISVFDISASRLANVESHVKLWPILALALLLWAGQKRQWELYVLSGIALALGLLTYDTVLPLLIVVILLAVIEFFSQKVDFKTSIAKLAGLIFPILLILPILIPYFSSRLGYYAIEEKGWSTSLRTAIGTNLSAVLQSLFIAARFDFIYNRQGPLLNAILLPFLVLGFIIVIFSLKKQFSRWMLLWALLTLLPVPILTNSPFGRVYYPALPAIYAIIALGIYLFAKEINRLLAPNLTPFGIAVWVTVLIWLPLLNFYIYFNEVGDPSDRQIRREIGDLVLVVDDANTHLYLPHYPGVNDPLEIEIQSVELNLHRFFPVDQIPEIYTAISYDDFLPTLLSEAQQWKEIVVLLDKKSDSRREHRDQVTDTLLRCFPGGLLREGYYFDRYTLDSVALSNPRCFPVQLSLSQPQQNSENQSISLEWSLSAGSASNLQLFCNQIRPDVTWIEAENFVQGPGWQTNVAFVTDWQGNGYLVDSYESGFSIYDTSFEESEVYAWVRYYKRAEDTSPAYLRLDDQFFTFADVSGNDLNHWQWEAIGPFQVTNNSQQWKISRPYNDDPAQFMALFIDTIVLTSDPQFNPNTDGLWQADQTLDFSFPHPIQHGDLPLDLPTGRYHCLALTNSKHPLVDAYGQSPVHSEEIEVVIP